MRDLNVTLVQTELVWEDPAANRSRLADLLRRHAPDTDLIVLPEMFTTGFSMHAETIAEECGGPTEEWLASLARQFDCAVTGSLPVRSDDAVFNRMFFVTPRGSDHYDKRHLFRMAGEHQAYAPGTRRVIVDWRDWRIKLEVCYDLRFPVFSRNRRDYDLLLNVANWPARRAAHWRTLLAARAIENQACVVGVNRIGEDGAGVRYSGDSMAFDARGQVLVDLEDRDACQTVTLDAQSLVDYRERFPCALDADAFALTL